MQTLIILLLGLFSYLLGSIPFGYIVARKNGVNLHQVGSKSTGATNVMRTIGMKKGVFVFVLDALKAMPVIVIVHFLNYFGVADYTEVSLNNIFGEPVNIYGFYGLMAVVGHIFPIYLKFKGGKAVATSFGVSLILLPFAAGLGILTFLIIVLTTKYVSLGSMIGASVTFVTSVIMFILKIPKSPPVHLSYIITFLLLVSIIILRHRSNIKRLKNKEENKINGK